MYGDDSFASGYAVGRDAANNNYGNGMFGDGAWWLIILLFFGWGGNGFGWGGNGGAYMNGALTRGDLCQDISFNNLDSAVRSLQSGLCDSTYALNNAIQNGFATTAQTLCAGFNGVDRSILTTSNQTQQAINQLGFNLQSCCCNLSREIEGTRTAIVQQTCDLINNQNANTQRIMDFMCQEKIAGLQAENAALTTQLSQNAQTNAIVSALSPKQPMPAYQVYPPYPVLGQYGLNPFNNGGNCNNGCGCNGL